MTEIKARCFIEDFNSFLVRLVSFGVHFAPKGAYYVIRSCASEFLSLFLSEFDREQGSSLRLSYMSNGSSWQSSREGSGLRGTITSVSSSIMSLSGTQTKNDFLVEIVMLRIS